ncbi:MAG: ABC transporter permease [Akkermansiaceae bacterium]|nr:ABC transporter permease [Akkermansiaceae bacterium]
MTRYILRRVLQGVVVLFVLETLTFFLVRALPGNPFMGDRKLPEHVLAQLNSLYGLDQSAWVQYAHYWKAILLQGDFGPSLVREGVQVSSIIAQSFPVSLLLGSSAMLLAVGVGIPAGMLAAYARNRWPDALLMLAAIAGVCIPSFVVAPVLGLTLGMHFPGLSVAGWDDALCVVLPAVALGAVNAAYVARLTRGGMVEALSSDFVRTARAKGAGPARILWVHALRCGLLPAVSYLGPAFAALITGSFVVETCFQVPGMGLHFVNATTDRDYFLIQGLVLCYGVLIVAANLVVDIVLVLMNPRLRT